MEKRYQIIDTQTRGSWRSVTIRLRLHVWSKGIRLLKTTRSVWILDPRVKELHRVQDPGTRSRFSWNIMFQLQGIKVWTKPIIRFCGCDEHSLEKSGNIKTLRNEKICIQALFGRKQLTPGRERWESALASQPRHGQGSSRNCLGSENPCKTINWTIADLTWDIWDDYRGRRRCLTQEVTVLNIMLRWEEAKHGYADVPQEIKWDLRTTGTYSAFYMMLEIRVQVWMSESKMWTGSYRNRQGPGNQPIPFLFGWGDQTVDWLFEKEIEKMESLIIRIIHTRDSVTYSGFFKNITSQIFGRKYDCLT